MNLRKIIFGNPLKTSSLNNQCLSKTKALAIFSSDLLSTIAYATEEIIIVLGLAFTAQCTLPIAVLISILVVILASSYFCTIKEYPTGGGAFSVAHKNLGENYGLLAAAALALGYTLTVAVSLSASAEAIASAFPSLASHTLALCMIPLGLIMLANLRGTQESASLLAFPTYGFIITIFLLIICGLIADAPANIPVYPTQSIKNTDLTPAIVFLLFQAFAAGSTVMAGIESISCGVPSFRPPKVKNSQVTLCCVVTILLTLFLGVSYLTHKFGIYHSETETVLSQIAKRVSGGSGCFYYLVQIMTAIILIMAANTSFSGFPRLASILAKEKYIPTTFANLGDRLAFSNGIIFLTFISAILLLIFNGNTHALIALYSVGVFISFSLSQAGLIKQLIQEKKESWYLKTFISSIGLFATITILFITIYGKFLDGAWIVTIIIPTIMFLFKKIKMSYAKNHKALDPRSGGLGAIIRSKNSMSDATIVVPVTKIHKGTLSAIKFAKSISNNVTAVIVNTNHSETDKLKLAWTAMHFKIPLVILESPYRSIITPFLDYLDELDKASKNKEPTIVVMPSFVPQKIWQNILHNQTATILKTALLYKKKSTDKPRIIVDVPYQL